MLAKALEHSINMVVIKESIGTIGKLGCISFNGNKVITTGGVV